MNPITAWKKAVLQNYANFGGRARRSEYWHFALANVAAITLLFGLALALSELSFLIAAVLFYLAMILPHLAITARRLHDVGQSGWWMLISLIPGGGIAMLIWACVDSQPGSNKWGVSEKYPS